jgi:peroxiredoxin
MGKISRRTCLESSVGWFHGEQHWRYFINAPEQSPHLVRGSHLDVPSTWVSFLTVALLLSVGLNVLLARKVRLLAAKEAGQVSDHLLGVGMVVQPITTKRPGGEREVIAYQGQRPTVLYVFSPQCEWCARNIDNFRTIVGKANQEYRVIGLSLSEEGLEDYVASNHLDIPVYVASKDVQKQYRLGVTPQTLVISPEGRVLKDWAGAYAGQQKSQIEHFFHLKLPGLRSGS